MAPGGASAGRGGQKDRYKNSSQCEREPVLGVPTQVHGCLWWGAKTKQTRQHTFVSFMEALDVLIKM